ncbi:hypothetical protein BBBOND_0105850 [Babesia bigemina]|uniref:Uncharacterized protein n=1 Tax=Babesia bigemina TaxID=5866 RepID=A0A061D0C0_BABBI|nr:hypothetical protein BBBOND_0105850 [Babesia bigemina]CDR94276.1 hypothetical protein BBBOND_0105850 [Babesia bigemina]|eukprot:XP_012766462.1 hypothetical protein BBBOND_0105850 [Babesia bigemina]
MVYDSLTDPPHNLKECIDWLIAVRGDDGKKNVVALGEAVHKFLADKPVGKMEVPALEEVKLITKEFLEKPELQNRRAVRAILRRFNKPMRKVGFCHRLFGRIVDSDYENVIETKGLTAENIAENIGEIVEGCKTFLDHIKIPDQYKSAYGPEATWDASCSEKPEACAVIFVGIAPMLYAGIQSLWKICTARVFKASNFEAEKHMPKVLKALGYATPEFPPDLNVLNVTCALLGFNRHMVTNIYDLAGFWAFY